MEFIGVKKHFCQLLFSLFVLNTGTNFANEAKTPPSISQKGEEKPDEEKIEKLSVVGFRHSLSLQARDKKEAIGIVDTIEATDMGKFPDANIAESLNRVPGVVIRRDADGSGMQVMVRGLGATYVKVLLNNNSISTPSTGPLDILSNGREVDLNLLPSELFTKLSVIKSSSANLDEGGISGTINMRSARASDYEGDYYFSGAVQGSYNASQKKPGGKITALGMKKFFDDKLGAVFGVVYNNTKNKIVGYESGTGIVRPFLGSTQSDNPNSNLGKSNFYSVNTLEKLPNPYGVKIDKEWLKANNPGVTIDQVNNAIFPRLPRLFYLEGDQQSYSNLLSLEYRPIENIYLYLDTLYSHKNSDQIRNDISWDVRTSGNLVPVPTQIKVDKDDCTNGCTGMYGVFPNSQYSLEFRPWWEKSQFFSINPGIEWNITDEIRLDFQTNFTSGKMDREAPTVQLATGSGTVTFNNSSKDFPITTFSKDLNNPDNFGWNNSSSTTTGYTSAARVNISKELRDTHTKDVKLSISWEYDTIKLRAGIGYNNFYRKVISKDGSAGWQNAVCGNNPSIYLPAPNTAAACLGLNTPGVSASSAYPGAPAGTVYLGSLIPNNSVPSYLLPGKTGFVQINWEKFAKDSKYSSYRDMSPESLVSGNMSSAYSIDEKIMSYYFQGKNEHNIFDHRLIYELGLRIASTNQTSGAPNLDLDILNLNNSLKNGAKVATAYKWIQIKRSYNNLLPSGTAAFSILDDLILRGSYSKTITRASPSGMRPNSSFTDPTANNGTIGNPALNPFNSNNYDLSLEYYTGKEGYIAASGFLKSISGFTTTAISTMPFNNLADYGILFANLTPTQQQAILSRGGPDIASVQISTTVNNSEKIKIKGLELTWVQPLDRFLPINGFTISGTLTSMAQSTTSEIVSAQYIPGVPERTYNLSGFYGNHGVNVRLAWNLTKAYKLTAPGAFGIGNLVSYMDDYSQLDLSTSYALGDIFNWSQNPELIFNILNLTHSKLRKYVGFKNIAYEYYDPGVQMVLGARIKF